VIGVIGDEDGVVQTLMGRQGFTWVYWEWLEGWLWILVVSWMMFLYRQYISIYIDMGAMWVKP